MILSQPFLVPTAPQIPCTTLLIAQLKIILRFFVWVWSGMYAMPVSCARPGAHSSGRIMAFLFGEYIPVLWKSDKIFLGVIACIHASLKMEEKFSFDTHFPGFFACFQKAFRGPKNALSNGRVRCMVFGGRENRITLSWAADLMAAGQ